MSDLAKELSERISGWPDEAVAVAVAELFQTVIDIEVKHFGVYRLNDGERAAVREGFAQAERGEFVSDEDIVAYFNRYRS